jgi:hypothetical protein
MMCFNPEVSLSIKGRNVAERQTRGREINECYSETKENRGWGLLPGDQRRVISPLRLEQPMK